MINGCFNDLVLLRRSVLWLYNSSLSRARVELGLETPQLAHWADQCCWQEYHSQHKTICLLIVWSKSQWVRGYCWWYWWSWWGVWGGVVWYSLEYVWECSVEQQHQQGAALVLSSSLVLLWSVATVSVRTPHYHTSLASLEAPCCQSEWYRAVWSSEEREARLSEQLRL